MLPHPWRDTKFSQAFDNVFVGEGIDIILTPLGTSKAIAERVMRSVRIECLDHLLILYERHLWKGLTEYIGYYITARPHQVSANKHQLRLMLHKPARFAVEMFGAASGLTD